MAEQQHSVEPSPRRDLPYALAIAVVVAAVYYGTLSFGLFNDDYVLARAWSAREVLATFSGPFDPTGFITAYYRPLASLSFGLDWLIWQTDTFGHHLTNLTLHIITSLLFFRQLPRFSLPRTAVVAGTLFFALVPCNAPTVIYVAERTDAMVAIAILLGMSRVDRYRETGRWTHVAVLNALYVVALMAKEMAVAMVAFVAIYWLDRTLNSRAPEKAFEGPVMAHAQRYLRDVRHAILAETTRREWLALLLPMLACTVLYLVFRHAVMPPGSLLDRFGEGLNPARAFVAGVHSTIKGVPWGIPARYELPLLVAAGGALIAWPRSARWRTVATGSALIGAGVLPLCFNGGVEPRLLYVAELGMSIVFAALVAVWLEGLATLQSGTTRALKVAAGGTLATWVTVGFALCHRDAQASYGERSELRAAKEVNLWLEPSAMAVLPAANAAIVRANLFRDGLIDENGAPTQRGLALRHSLH